MCQSFNEASNSLVVTGSSGRSSIIVLKSYTTSLSLFKSESLNKEAKYALNYFGVKEPIFLNDVKLKVKDSGFIITNYAEYLEKYRTSDGTIPPEKFNKIAASLYRKGFKNSTILKKMREI